MSRLSVDLLLEQERTRNTAPREAKARSRARLSAILAVAPLPAAAATTASKVALTKIGAALLVGAAVGASVTAGTMTARAPEPPVALLAPPAPHVSKHVPKVALTTKAPRVTPSPSPSPSPIPTPIPTPSPILTPSPTPTPTPTPSPPATFAPSAMSIPSTLGAPASSAGAERALVDRARAAIGRGDAASAIRDGEEHASRFPQGQLAAEREAILVRALVLGGRDAEARARAERFHRTYPNSPLAPAVEGALTRFATPDGVKNARPE